MPVISAENLEKRIDKAKGLSEMAEYFLDAGHDEMVNDEIRKHPFLIPYLTPKVLNDGRLADTIIEAIEAHPSLAERFPDKTLNQIQSNEIIEAIDRQLDHASGKEFDSVPFVDINKEDREMIEKLFENVNNEGFRQFQGERFGENELDPVEF